MDNFFKIDQLFQKAIEKFTFLPDRRTDRQSKLYKSMIFIAALHHLLNEKNTKVVNNITDTQSNRLKEILATKSKGHIK